MILAVLVALSLPVAMMGMISVDGNFNNVVITGAEGTLRGEMSFMNTEIGEIRLIDCVITIGGAQIHAGDQRSFITVENRSLKGDLSIVADIDDGALHLSGDMEAGGLRINTGGSTLKARNCTFTGKCRSLTFASAKEMRVTMNKTDGLSGLWMGGEYRRAKSAVMENGDINVVEGSIPDAGWFFTLSLRLWIAALVLLLFSAHVSRKTRFEKDRKAGRNAGIVALFVVLVSLYVFHRSFVRVFGPPLATTDSAAMEVFSFSVLFLLLGLPLHYCIRSIAKILGFRRAAPPIGLMIALSFLAYLAFNTAAIEALTLSVGGELIGAIPFLH